MKARQDSPNNFWKRVCKLKLKIATIKIISYLWQAINQKIEAKAFVMGTHHIQYGLTHETTIITSIISTSRLK